MRNHDIEMILRGLYLSEYGQYNKEEVIRAILWANDLGFTDGRQCWVQQMKGLIVEGADYTDRHGN